MLCGVNVCDVDRTAASFVCLCHISANLDVRLVSAGRVFDCFHMIGMSGE